MACRSRKKPIDRFKEKYTIDPSTKCWNWTACTDRDGYGCFRFSHESGKSSWGKAYTFSYEHFVGVIPDGMQIDHKCRNRACVNPDHLRVMTLIENVMIGNSPPAKNARKTHCKHGHSLNGDNLYVQPSTGYRYCRTCKRESEKRCRKN